MKTTSSLFSCDGSDMVEKLRYQNPGLVLSVGLWCTPKWPQRPYISRQKEAINCTCTGLGRSAPLNVKFRPCLCLTFEPFEHYRAVFRLLVFRPLCESTNTLAVNFQADDMRFVYKQYNVPTTLSFVNHSNFDLPPWNYPRDIQPIRTSCFIWYLSA